MKQVEKIRWAVCNVAPWIGSIALSVDWEEGESAFGTAHTDGSKIVFDPQVLADTSQDGIKQQKSIGLHEVLHVALAHCQRRAERQPMLWNLAVDDRVNRLMQEIIDETDSDLVKPQLGQGWVFVQEADDDMTAEGVYSLLLDKFKDQLQGGGEVTKDGGEVTKDGGDEDDDNQPGAPCPGDGQWVIERPDGTCEPITDPELKELLEELDEDGTPGADVHETGQGSEADEADAQEVLSKTRRALEDARDRGEIPGSLVDQFGLGETKINWKDMLVNLVSHVHDARDDYSYIQQEPSYRLQGYIAPTLNSPTCSVAVALDTSGSIAREELNQFLAEAWGIIQSGATATIIPFTGDVWEQGVETIEPGTPAPELAEYPSGGTAFQPVFDYIEEERLEVDAVVFLTDGHAPEPEDPGIPVLWVTTSQCPADFGVEVPYEL